MIECSLEEGIRESTARIKDITDIPKLIAVYGWPNSGKSYFINRIADILEKIELECYRGSGSLNSRTFEDLKANPLSFKQVLFIHCAWDRIIRRLENGNIHVAQAHEDPNELAKNILERKVNLNIGIYNPKLYSKLSGLYDILINNENSVTKEEI